MDLVEEVVGIGTAQISDSLLIATLCDLVNHELVKILKREVPSLASQCWAKLKWVEKKKIRHIMLDRLTIWESELVFVLQCDWISYANFTRKKCLKHMLVPDIKSRTKWVYRCVHDNTS